MNDNIIIMGYSVGDISVGIGQGEFEIDTGVSELSPEDKEFLINGVVRDIWELHDNGDVNFNFSDEMGEPYYEFSRVMNRKKSEEILKKLKEDKEFLINGVVRDICEEE